MELRQWVIAVCQQRAFVEETMTLCDTNARKHSAELVSIKDGPWGGRVEAGLAAPLHPAREGEIHNNN